MNTTVKNGENNNGVETQNSVDVFYTGFVNWYVNDIIKDFNSYNKRQRNGILKSLQIEASKVRQSIQEALPRAIGEYTDEFIEEDFDALFRAMDDISAAIVNKMKVELQPKE